MIVLKIFRSSRSFITKSSKTWRLARTFQDCWIFTTFRYENVVIVYVFSDNLSSIKCISHVFFLWFLGKENLPYIFDYSGWVLKSRPEYGLKVNLEFSPTCNIVAQQCFTMLPSFEQTSEVHHLARLRSCYHDVFAAVILNYNCFVVDIYWRHSRSRRVA
jgi:hypothetical protein